MAQRGLAVARRSLQQPLSEDVQVYIADTLGELGLFFRLADLVIMGGSLTGGVGGHNPWSPRAWAWPSSAARTPPISVSAYAGLLIGPRRDAAAQDQAALNRLVERLDRRSGAWRGRWASAPRPTPRATIRPWTARSRPCARCCLRPRHEAGHAALVVFAPGRARAGNRALLRPVSWVWAVVTARKIARARPFDPGIPVICVGNLTVGGTGKTPIVRELIERLVRRGVARPRPGARLRRAAERTAQGGSRASYRRGGGR